MTSSSQLVEFSSGQMANRLIFLLLVCWLVMLGKADRTNKPERLSDHRVRELRRHTSGGRVYEFSIPPFEDEIRDEFEAYQRAFAGREPAPPEIESLELAMHWPWTSITKKELQDNQELNTARSKLGRYVDRYNGGSFVVDALHAYHDVFTNEGMFIDVREVKWGNVRCYGGRDWDLFRNRTDLDKMQRKEEILERPDLNQAWPSFSEGSNFYQQQWVMRIRSKSIHFLFALDCFICR